MSIDPFGFVSGAASAAATYYGQKEANKVNKQIAREQMQFQERMSNTSYQRQMADMEAAGINPMYAMNAGGASTPPGASTQVQNELGSAVSSAKDAALAMANLKNLREQNRKIGSDVRLNEALTESARQDAQVKATTSRHLNAQIGLAGADLARKMTENELLQSKIPAAKQDKAFDESKVGEWVRWFNRVFDNPISNSIYEVGKGLILRK